MLNSDGPELLASNDGVDAGVGMSSYGRDADLALALISR